MEGGEYISKKLEKGKIKKWSKTIKKENLRNEQKERIREAFSNTAQVVVIPPSKNLRTNETQLLRVAAYCRVSTLEETQAGSFELQCQHFREYIEQNPDWQFVDIFSDEGVSGTSMTKRIGFMNMIDTCKAGKIDLIVTKSVSRFARNTRDCLHVVRQLKQLNPPVGVFFETEALNTLESKNEFTLGVMSLVAQGESEQKSASIKWAFVERAKKGIPCFSTHNLLGYDKDPLRTIIIVEEEAEIVRYIYDSYMEGSSTREIAIALMEARVPTVTGKEVWSGSAVLNILRNEKYCGDCLMQKTYTIDCFSHKSVKNRGEITQYYLTNTHIPIIPREQWEKAQKQVAHRTGTQLSKNIPLEQKFHITRIKGGLLKGFIILDPKWNNWEINQFFHKINV